MLEAPSSILLVDDAPENLHVFGEMLKRSGHALRAVTDAASALRVLSRVSVDLAVIDIHMPGVGGFELCDTLKGDTRYRHIPVIFLSADQDTAQKVEALRRGGVDYITKPFQPEEVRARVETQLRLIREQRHAVEMRDEMMRQERLASIGRLVAGIAHEVSTPLGVAATASTLLEDTFAELVEALRSPRPSRAAVIERLDASRESLKLLTSNLARASELMARFKQTAVDKTSDAVRPVELGAYVTDVVASLAPLYRKRRVAVRVACPTPVEVTAPVGALAQVVTNLLQNAMFHAFTPEAEGAVTFEVEGDATHATLRCTDDGCGIDDATAARVFDAFFSTRTGRGGSGLGLYLVRGIVSDILHGAIELRSSPGRGATFTVRFPRAATV